MTMFDKTPEIKVSMTGTEYIAYRESRRALRKPLSKNAKKALPYFVFCGLGIFLIMFLIGELTYKEPPKSFISGWYESMPKMVTQSWNSIAKFTFLAFRPLIVVMISLAWLLHGFGFLIFKG